MRVDIYTDQTSDSIYTEIHCREITEDVRSLESYVKRYDSKLLAREGAVISNVPLDSVFYIESVDKKTFIYTEDRVLQTDLRLYELEEILDRRDFFRCSKSTIINLSKVSSLKPELTRNLLAKLTNGEKVLISRRYAVELKKLLGI